MAEYVAFHYMPLEGKITGKQVLKQTEDVINDLGNKVYNLDIDQSKIDEAVEKSEEAVNTANAALSAVTTGRSVWFNTVAEMVTTDIEAGVTAETKGYYVANDGGNALYLIRQEKSGDVVDGGSLIALDNGNMAELVTDGTVNVKQFGAVGNGTDDDTTVFQNTSSYAQTNGFVPFVGVATYKITGAVTGSFNSFGEVTITGGGTVDIINLQEVVSDVSEIRDEVVDKTASAKTYSENAQASATNAANSASSASTTAAQLMTYLEDKEEITAPAVDPTLTISGAAADAKATGDALQNIIPSENQFKPQLYDNDNPTIINGFLGNVSGQKKFSASPAAKCLCFPVTPNTKYMFAAKKASIIGGRRDFGYFTSIPTDQTYGEFTGVTTESVGDWTYYKFTTSATAQYIVMYYYNSNDGVAEATIRQEFMLTEGWTIYPYLYYGQVAKLLVFKDNLADNGTAGQTLMVDEDGTSLIWGTPAVSVELDDTLTQAGKAADAKATGDAIASTKTELETEIGQVVLTDGVQEWLDDHPEAMIVIKRNGDADDTPVLDNELLSSSGWTSTGWTGDFTNGFTHTTGNTNPLTLTIPTLVEGGLYQFQITTSNAATNGWSDFYVSLGGSPTFETYKGGGASVSYTYGLICGSTKVLTITPRNDYTGTVTGLSLKKVTNTVGTQYELYDTNGNTTFEFRTVKNTQNALYMGVNSGSKSFYGYENVAVGDRALRDNTGGFWNTAVGRRALESNQMGSRNVAIGYIALLHNTGGDRNVAVGTFALESNTTGRGNTAINADALQDNTTGSYNTAIGVGAGSGVGGSNNIAIGNRALASNTAGGGNIALGRYTMEKATAGSNNIAIGHQCCDESGITGSNNIAIGYNVALPSTTGSNQIVIGTSSHTSVVIAGKVLTFNNDGTVTWTSA